MDKKGEEEGKKRSAGSSGNLAQGIEDVKKQLTRGGLNREEILLQIKDLEKEKLKERIVELELSNQQLLRRNALLTQSFEQLRMNVAILKARLELAFEEETVGPPASLLAEKGKRDPKGAPKGRGLTISQFRDDWKRGVSSADLREDDGILNGGASVHRMGENGGKSARSALQNKGVNTTDKEEPVEKDNDKGKEKTLRTTKRKIKEAARAAETEKDVEVREKVLKNEVLGDMEDKEGDQHLDGIVLSIKETVTNKKATRVRAGTPIKLLERLANADAPDPDYVADFVLTFTRFMKPADLLDFLCIRFLHAKGQDNEQVIRLRVVNVLKLWIERNNQVLLKKTKMKQRMSEFISVLMGTTGMSSTATSMKNLLERITKENEGLSEYEVSATPNAVIRKGDFTKIKDEELGSQLTLIHHQLWNCITPNDLFAYAQEESTGEHLYCKTTTSKMLYLPAAIQRWIELEFSCKDTDEGTVLIKLVNIAEHCLQFKNYHAVFDIMSGLRHALKDREEEVLKMSAASDTKKRGQDVAAIYNKLKQFTSDKNNYESYRTTLAQQNLPCVPYFGLLWNRVQAVKEDPDKFRSNGYVNFEKLQHLANVVKDIQTYQKVRYSIQPLKAAHEYLMDVLQLKAKGG